MKLLYLEARKGIIRRYVVIALLLFLCLNVAKIVSDYHAGEIRPVAGNTTGMETGYYNIYRQVSGPITKEAVSFITSEYQRLRGATADGTYSREPQEGTYSGYLYGDFYLFHKYFYPNIEYSVKYSDYVGGIIDRASENLTFFRENDNTEEVAKNSYILKHYSNRRISEFYLYDGWEALLSYDFSDLLILLLLVLTIAPVYTREKENSMISLLHSCKRGSWPLQLSKCVTGTVFACTVVMLFSIANLVIFGVLCGFEGWNSPLYAIESYSNTPFAGSILSFYLLNMALKAIGFSIIAIILIFLSCCFEKTLYPCLLGFGIAVLLCFFSGWSTSPLWWQQMLAYISPFTLTKGWCLLESLYGTNIGGLYLLKIQMVLIIQFLGAGSLVFAIRRKSCFILK